MIVRRAERYLGVIGLMDTPRELQANDLATAGSRNQANDHDFC